jgi:hypothetical protein
MEKGRHPVDTYLSNRSKSGGTGTACSLFPEAQGRGPGGDLCLLLKHNIQNDESQNGLEDSAREADLQHKVNRVTESGQQRDESSGTDPSPEAGKLMTQSAWPNKVKMETDHQRR